MSIQLPDGRLLSDEVLEALRLRALHGRELGYTEAELADLLGVQRETICRWWTAYGRGGLQALPEPRTGRPLGSGRLLEGEQARQLQTQLDQYHPNDLGIAALRWTRRAVRELIQPPCGLTLALRTVGAYLHRWGYPPQRPARKARQQDPQEVRRWLEQTYPALEQRAAAEGAEIYWCDEEGVGMDDDPGRSYARRGQTPEKEVTASHARVKVVSAINHQDAAHFLTLRGTVDAAAFVTFLEQWLRETSKKIFLILDHLQVHDRAEVTAWVAARSERLELIPLPKYVPERNPVEYLNQDTKEEVHAQGLPKDAGELDCHVDAILHKLAYWPERIMSYFCHPKVQDAAANSM